MATKNPAHLPSGGAGDPDNYPEGDELPGEDYARYARALWDEQEEELRPLHDVWVQNLLFLSGRQWWQKTPLGDYRPPVVPEYREQPVSNLSLAFFRTFLAKTTKQRPAWQVVPASTDPEDMQAAQLAEDVLIAKWVELRLGRMLRMAVAWAIATGNSFLYPFWNTDTGKVKGLEVEVEVPEYDPETGEQIGTEKVMCPCDENGEPMLTADGRPDLSAQPHYIDEGEIGVRVYSPFQVRVTPNAEYEEDVTWTIIAEAIPLRDALLRWPDKEGYMIPEEPGAVEDYDRMVGSMLAASDTQLHSGADERDREIDKVLVLHYHERPSPTYPEGRYWVSCGQDCLLEEPGPLPEGIWPCVIHLTDIPVPGRYHAMATLESIVGLNREYNEINAQVKEHHNLMARGKWLVERGTGIKKGMITNQPGEVIQVNTGFINGIKQADIKALPSAVYSERERVLGDWEMVSGIHRASMGQAPKGVTAGVALLQLQEADDSDIGPFLSQLEEAVAELAGAILKIIQERYTEERLVHVSGPNKRYLAKTFKGSDLAGCSAVIPVSESSFPWSKTARQEMMIQLATNLPGLFTDAETGLFDKGRFARLLPLGGLESITDNEDLDIQEALREEEMFSLFGVESLEYPEVMWWQDHLVHYRQHAKVLKSANYREWSPEAQQLFAAHVQMHEMEAMKKMMPPAPAGAPGDPSAPPGEEAPPEEGGSEVDLHPQDSNPAQDYDPEDTAISGAAPMMPPMMG